jgi:Right handed beta helix region
MASRILRPILRILPALLLASGEHAPADYFAAPDGVASGEGTIENPWDLQTALAHPLVIQPGDRLWLRGGVYSGNFTSRLTGAATRPIVVRNYRGERAILDAPGEPKELQVLKIDGAWTWYWGLEVMSSWPERIDPPKQRAAAISVYGPNVKLINMAIHDAFGVGFWSGSDDSEMYGNLVYNNGHDSSDRGHGHGIYAQNRDGAKLLTDNIVFQNFSHGIHVFGSDEAFLNNFTLEGNVAFDNGVLSKFGEERNILVGGGVVANKPVLISNFTYWSKATSLGQNNIGYLAGCAGLKAKNNYFALGIAFMLIRCEPEILEGNTFIGSVTGFDRTQFSSNTYYPYGTKPESGVEVFVRPNQFEKGRAHVIVYNWELKNRVSIDLTSVLNEGQEYEIRDAQDYFGSPVTKGTYGSLPVEVPMGTTAVSAPVGKVPNPPVHTSAEFGVFIVLPVSPPEEAKATEPVVVPLEP